MELKAFWQDEGDKRVEQIIKSWFPLVIRVKQHDIPIVETATEKPVGKLVSCICSKKMQDVIGKQIQLMHPEKRYDYSMKLKKNNDGSIDILGEEKI